MKKRTVCACGRTKRITAKTCGDCQEPDLPVAVSGGKRKPFLADVYVSTFADSSLRVALEELKRTNMTPNGVLTRLWSTLAINLQIGPSTITSLTRSLVYEEAARRWARDYDKAIQKRYDELIVKRTQRLHRRLLATKKVKKKR